MPKAYCSHCQGAERGTSENAKFSIKELYPNGRPMVEVLKNGGPIHPFGNRFVLDVRKVQLLLSCLPVLSKFYHSSDAERNCFEQELIEDRRFNCKVLIYVEPRQKFQRSTGEVIERPWLMLDELSESNIRQTHIGLGALRCRAICEVQQDLRYWLGRVGICRIEVVAALRTRR